MNCEICGKKFSSKGNLTQHVRQIHNRERNYRCEDCGRTFTRGNDMRRHRGRVHRVRGIHKVRESVTTYTKTETTKTTEIRYTTEKQKVVTKKSRGSKGERDVENTLRGYTIGYIREKTFDGLTGLGGGPLRYDFAVPVGCGFLLIEYDGKQHFVPTRWGSMTAEKAEKQFEKLKQHDQMKNDYARSHGYPLLRIPYYRSYKIYDVVRKFLMDNGLIHWISISLYMASVVAGGLFNALAFAGAGFLFSKLNHTGYEAEIKRHNYALEQLARAKEKWYESEVDKKDRIQRLRQELSDANADINTTNHALDLLKDRLRQAEVAGSSQPKPELSDYYKPSSEMKEYQALFIGSVGLVGGYLMSRFVL